MVGTVLDEIDNQGKVTEFMTTFPTFGSVLNKGMTPIHASHPTRPSCGIPSLHMQRKAHEPRGNPHLDLKYFEHGVGVSLQHSDGYLPSSTTICF